MYSAKRSKSGGLHTFTPDMALVDPNEFELPTDSSESAERGAAVRLLGELRHAIDHGDLTVFYQPKFDLRSGDVVGVEALVRWPHPKRGLLGPDHFLPLVRKRGLMRAVTDIVLTQALDDAAEWHAMGIGVPIAVNVFAPSLGDLDLPTHIASALAEARAEPGRPDHRDHRRLPPRQHRPDPVGAGAVAATRNSDRHRRFRQRLLGPVVPARAGHR